MFVTRRAMTLVAALSCAASLRAAEAPGARAAEGPDRPTIANERIVHAADAFLATLSDAQRQRVLFAYDDAQQRARWSNFPTGIFLRAGVSLKEMSGAQRQAAFDLLAAVLSPKGVEKVNHIRAADDNFRENGSKKGPRDGRPSLGAPALGPPPPGVRRGVGPPPAIAGPGPGGRDDLFGSDLYYFSFLGKPSTTAPWMLQFGGHHLALNISMAGSTGVLTPSLTGAQPAAFTVSGRTLRPLGAESDKALGLLASLDDGQRKRAVLTYRVADLVLGPGRDGQTIVPEGLEAAAMNEHQRELLLDLIAEWAGIINEPAAAARMALLKADLAATWFAWSGSTAGESGSNITAYYRIQGPHLVIEYAPQSDEPANHVHTIYRDPSNDYGRQ